MIVFGISACDAGMPEARQAVAETDSGRKSFAHVVDSLLLDTEMHELRAHVSVVVHNPDRNDESPFMMAEIPPGALPGHHTRDGEVFADIEVLRELLGRDLSVRLDTANQRFFVGVPEVVIYGHRHGDAWFVPVKLFSRQFGAYADVGCTLTTCANIWPRTMLEYARDHSIIGTAMLEAHAEGLIDIDVRSLPTG
jgi:hypothetical protein